MECARLILEYLEVLAWPVVAAVAIVMFRSSIVALLHRLKSANLPGSVTLDFADGIREAQQLSRDVSQQQLPERAKGRPSIPLTEANSRMLQLGLRPSPSGLDLSYYRNLATSDANIALAGLRMEVETLARNLAKGFDVPVSDRDSAGTLLRKLYDAHAITSDQFRLAQKIIQLCNAAVHGYALTREEADAVIDVAQVLARQYVSWLGWGFDDGWTATKPDGG